MLPPPLACQSAHTLVAVALLDQIVENKQVMGDSIAEANWSLTGVYYAAGADIKYQVGSGWGAVLFTGRVAC